MLKIVKCSSVFSSNFNISRNYIYEATNMTKECEIIKFEDGDFSLDVNVSPKEDTVWLTQEQIAKLYERDRKTITRHIQNIYKDLELEQNSVCSFFEHTASDGKT